MLMLLNDIQECLGYAMREGLGKNMKMGPLGASQVSLHSTMASIREAGFLKQDEHNKNEIGGSKSASRSTWGFVIVPLTPSKKKGQKVRKKSRRMLCD